MSRPLWGKGDRVSGGRGELASDIDCLATNAPTPTTAVQTNRITHGRPYNTASELSLSEPSRAHLSPKGEAIIYAVGVCTTVLSLLASIIGSRNL